MPPEGDPALYPQPETETLVPELLQVEIPYIPEHAPQVKEEGKFPFFVACS
jgi:hypothetical protein